MYQNVNKTCYITNALYASQTKNLVYGENYDFYQRRRCAGIKTKITLSDN